MTSHEGRPQNAPDNTDLATGDGSGIESSEGDLAMALDGLARMAVGAQSLESSLEWVAKLAVTAIPGAAGAGVTMQENGRPNTVCASDPFVRDVDDMQYGLGEGPCITAAAEARTVVSESLGADLAWPRFGPRARELGVLSALSLPLIMPTGEVMGAMNVYAHSAGAFDDAAVEQGETFAAAAAVVVNNARELMQARRLAEQLRTALSSRATIDQAIGILLSRQGGSPEDALASLKRLSQNQNIKLAVVAEDIVREAVLRARARHSG